MNWIKKALVLGSIFFLAIFVVKPIGVSTQFSVLTGMIYKEINPDIIWEDNTREYGYSSSIEYYDKSDGKLAKSIEHPLNYDFIFVLAIPLGGYLGYVFVNKGKSRRLKTVNQKRGFFKEYGPSFISGFLLLYGARMADGCTSGHMMSGIMQGSLSGYIFAGCVFLVAIPTAIILGKTKYRGGM